MANGLYYYKLQSPYPEDVTKNCKLTINEIDSNFLNLKDVDIKSAEFDRESKTLVLTRNNGEKLIVDLSDITYNLSVNTDCSESGYTITMQFDGKDGPQTVVIDKLVTVDNLMSIIGSDILTKVITDGTLKGDGTIDSPLGISGVEKTGMYAPVNGKIDLTNGGRLPEVAKLGTRYVTIEYINDYGYLYNGAGLEKIMSNLEEEGKGWRVPSKADWDALLNSIEPCEYQNHNSARCHVELGKVAGKYLKSECGWIGQPDCECSVTKPMTGCSADDFVEDNTEEYIDGDTDDTGYPTYNPDSPVGVDKYGMSILPAGVVTLDAFNRPQADGFKAQALFWTTSHVYDDCEQDRYVKEFVFNKSGVMQEAECPMPFYSVRLVKDYDGSNYFGAEYIDGVVYNTLLFPESGQIWLATNYAKKEGFIDAALADGNGEVAEVNNGEILQNRKALFLNEWNGRYWEKKLMHEGDTVVVENPCFEHGEDKEIKYCWKINDYGEEECDTITIHSEAQHNVEYRVYTTDDCNQDLVNTDDLVVERVLNTVLPIIIKEKEERISADTELWEALSAETEARISGDAELWTALEEEISARTQADAELNEKIDAEIERAMEAEMALDDKIEAEIARATAEEQRLDEKIDAETERAIAEEQRLDEKIDAETERATAEEQRLDEKIDAEIERAKEAEEELDKKIDDEIERATAREDEIDGQLIDTTEDYVLSASTEGSDYNLILKSKDGIEDHFVKIKFHADFGHI